MSFKTVSRDFSISTSVNAISRFACASWRIFIWKQDKSVFRFFTESWGKSSLGARLRTRKVRGRDASLPAPLLAASLGLVGRGTVGALPQTPQGTLSLDPFSRLSWSRFHAPSACSFLGLYRARERSHSTCFCSPARRGVPGKAIPVRRSFSSEYARWHKCPLNWGCASR